MSDWTRMEQDFDALKAQAEAAVTEWRWSRDPECHDPRPLVAERFGDAPPRWRAAVPAELRIGSLYGLDESGRVRIVTTFDDEGSRKSVELRAGDDAAAEEWRLYFLSPDGQQAVLRRRIEAQRMPDGRIGNATVWLSPSERQEETYGYDTSARLVGIDVDNVAADGSRELDARFVVLYDGDGAVAAVHDSEGGLGTVYRKPGTSVARELSAVEDGLVACITAKMMDIAAASPVFAVVLSHEDLLPPLIGFATAEDRDRWASEQDPDFSALWNPAHMTHRIETFDDCGPDRDALELAGRALEVQWGLEDDEDSLRDMCIRVAQRLNEWAQSQPAGVTTEDFVAIAVDETLDNLHADAYASGPHPRLRTLQERGLLPLR